MTITGEAASPSFYRLINRDPPSLVEASALTRVYATAGQARRAFKRQARRSAVRCELRDLASDVPPIKSFTLTGLPARAHAFRAAVDFEDGLQANYELIFLERGPSLTILELFALNGPPDLEQNLVSTLAARLR